MKALFVAWQDPETRNWIPVGRLTFEDGAYQFVYTRGARESKRFVPFGRMVDFEAVYVSNELLPLFANRILPKSRPEYREYLQWLGLDATRASDLEILGRSGGQRATDTLEIIPRPEPTPDHRYVVYFLAHGIRHLSKNDQARVATLKPAEGLLLMRDIQNPADTNALLMRTNDPISVVGYCPRYYAKEFCTLMDMVGQQNVGVTVEQVSPNAPSQLRLLCRIDAPWPADFSPCTQDAFVPIAVAASARGTVLAPLAVGTCAAVVPNA